MTDIIPTQIRHIDPYSSYSSQNANALTRIITLGEDVLLTQDSMEISLDSTAPTDHIIVSTGHAVKDDVLIQFTDDFRVDMSDPAFYGSSTALDETGYYYICIYYEYTKMKPPPEAKIRILKPSERDDISLPAVMFIGCVEINPSYEIENIFDYDPSDTSIFRPYPQASGVNVVQDLPPWSEDLEGLIYYEKSTGKFYGAGQTEWHEIELVNYATITNDYTASNYEIIMVDDSTSSITIYFPSNPLDGARIEVIDVGKLFQTSPITFDGNGKTIIGNSTIESSINYSRYVFTYNADKDEWFYAQSATSAAATSSTTITSDYSANPNEIIFVSDSTGSITVTFPDNPSGGDRVEIIDSGRLFRDNPITVDGNGSTIDSSITLTLDKNEAQYVFSYNEESDNWIVTISLRDPSGVTSVTINSDYSANINELILVDTSTDPLDVTLPSSPVNGSQIEIIDIGRLFNDNPITIDGNGNNIFGQATIDTNTNYSRYLFTFNTANNEWTYSHTVKVPSSRVVYSKITPSQMALDDTNVGSDGGNLFGIMETVDFAANEDGSIWTMLRFNKENLSLDQDIFIDIHYSLNGDDPGKEVELNTEYWTLDPSMSYDEDSPDSTAIQDIIISDSTSDINIGVYAEDTLSATIDSMYLTEFTEFISIKFTRKGSIDTYSGTFQLVALELYQKT